MGLFSLSLIIVFAHCFCWQVYDSSSGYLTNRVQTWIITPPGATTVSLRFTTFCTGVNDYVNVFACSDSSATSCQFAIPGKPLGVSGCTVLPAPVTVSSGVMKVTWTSSSSNSNNNRGWQAQYSSLKVCDPITQFLDGNLVQQMQSSVVVWTGDTVSFTSSSGMNLQLVDAKTGSLVFEPNTVVPVDTASPNVYALVDPLITSRNHSVVVLPLAPQTLSVYVTAVSTGYTMATVPGDPVQISNKVNPTIYITVGDKLVLARQTTGNPMVLCTSITSATCTLLSPSLGVTGQTTTHITWDTDTVGVVPGVYYYAQYPGAAISTVPTTASISTSTSWGSIVLTARPAGMTCEQCKTGEYCPNGVSVPCPANSGSPPESSDISACSCNAGFSRDTTNMQAYTNAQNVDTGGTHTCVVTQNSTDGTKQLYCWGSNTMGQLGQGSSSLDENLLPTPVDLPGVVSVSLGTDFTCVLLDTGRVRCWGGNSKGQLAQGDANSFNADLPINIPDSRLGENGKGYSANSLSCADFSCCALVTYTEAGTSGHGVKCWGSNSNQQLGISSVTTVGTTTSNINFITFASGTVISSVSCGGSTTCAIGTNAGGTYVYCWGSNSDGQLGRELTSTTSSSPDVVLLPSGVVPNIVNCYSGVCCVVTTKWQLMCWGRGTEGRLAGGSTISIGKTLGSMRNNLPFISVGSTAVVLDVMVGATMTCALLSNNHVKCWGSMAGTIYGNDLTELNDLLPNMQLQGSQQAVQLGGKSNAACAIMSDFSLVCWGDNQYMQLGDVAPNLPSDSSQPGLNSNVTNITLVSLGTDVVHSSGTPQTLTCSSCPANKYCLGGINEPQSCPANSSSPQQSEMKSRCVCLRGFYSVNNGPCTACSNTSYCVNGQKQQCPLNSGTLPGAFTASNCTCLPGYTNTSSSCTSCNKGTYKNVTGALPCTLCPAGTASSVSALSSFSGCSVCPAGTYSTPGSTSCTECQAGKSAPAGASECVDCPNGYYSLQGSGVCTGCPAGTYAPSAVISIDSCLPCLAGRYSAVVGANSSSSCQRCPAGQTSGANSTNCTQCPANTYSASGDSTCSQCPANSTSPPGSGLSGCTCLPGFRAQYDANVANFMCVLCGRGTWSSANSTDCTSCPAGTMQPSLGATNVSSCSRCPTGSSSSAGASACSVCAAGTFSTDGTCVTCLRGTWSTANSSTCTACDSGTYNTTTGKQKSDCTVCPAGYYCTGGANISLCPLGTYSGVTGYRQISSCGDCPAGSYCPQPFLKSICPSGTTSNPRSTSQLQCTCTSGYQCTYTKIVEAVISLSITPEQFNTPEVQWAFKQAVAAAAGNINPSMVYITKLVDTTTPAPSTARRLLSSEGTLSTPSPHHDDRILHVFVGVVGSDKLTNLSEHLSERSLVNLAAAWYAPHHVEVTTEPK